MAESLDFTILADFSGEVASRIGVLERLIQRTCVNVCNEQGWEIPFAQIMVHSKHEARDLTRDAVGSSPR